MAPWHLSRNTFFPSQQKKPASNLSLPFFLFSTTNDGVKYRIGELKKCPHKVLLNKNGTFTFGWWIQLAKIVILRGISDFKAHDLKIKIKRSTYNFESIKHTANIFKVIFTVFKCVRLSTVISLYGLHLIAAPSTAKKL